MRSYIHGLILLALYSVPFTLSSQLQSPDEFLGFEKGEKFIFHHDIVRYFEHCAANSDRMILQEYGKTYQGRPLLHATIGQANDITNIDEIRAKHLESMEGGSSTQHAVVWLSYGVHGNEAGATNSSPHVLYQLLSGPESDLEDIIVLIDPSLNPDGYSRYTNWYNDNGNNLPNHSHEALEHNEPSPSGRVNHYRHDLNRDWAWLTQVESQQRLRIYHSWMPHVHVDVHEQGHNSPYYFAPAAIPYHEYITDFQKDFQTTIGKKNAAAFDANGWLYFTKEVFDLLYPSYGDTYPTFNGSIGMTYEQAGHGQAGLAIQMENGHDLTLHDRIVHHWTTTLETVKTARTNKDLLIDAFRQFYNSPAPGQYKSYVIADDGSERLKHLCGLLENHGIEYGYAGGAKPISGFSYRSGKQERYTTTSSDIIISTDQSKRVLAQVLLDPQVKLQDSLTYDITAWSLPKAYGLDAYAVTSIISADGSAPSDSRMARTPSGQYAYFLRWNSLQDAAFVARLQDDDFKLRVSNSAFSTDHGSFPAGTVIILKGENFHKEDFFQELIDLADEHDVDLEYTESGFSQSGPDLGSSQMSFMTRPKVMILNGDDVYAYSFGEVWHFFEQTLQYPVTVTRTDQLQTHLLEDYTTIVMPEGRYGDISTDQWDQISAWVRRGGKIISLGNSHYALRSVSGLGLSTDSAEGDDAPDGDKLPPKYGNQERDYLPYAIPGAIFHLTLDETHPLTYGIGSQYYALVTGTTGYPLQDNAWNVSRWTEDQPVYGYAGKEAVAQMKNTSIHISNNYGRGQVIYLTENPLFRSFWYNGKLLVANALFF